MKISCVTTCMGRAHHIKKTLLPNMRGNPTAEFILLDYNSQDDLGRWVRRNCSEFTDNGRLQYFRTDGPKIFHPAHAKNMAALLSIGDVIVNVDADNFVGARFAEGIAKAFESGEPTYCHCCHRRGADGIWGRIAMLRCDFMKLGGYDEEMKGYGGEDVDLIKRARMLGLTRHVIPLRNCRAIPHLDSERSAFMDEKDTHESNERNKCKMYRHKHDRQIVVNAGREWGSGMVRRNWTDLISVGSRHPNGFLSAI